MTKIHGLFIPEQNYLIDLEGLLKYFQAKINQNNECLYCHKLKNTTSAIQTHMRDKGHCMVAFETEEEMIEVGQFYDFTSTYSDEDQDEMEISDAEIDHPSRSSNGGVKLPKTSQSRDEHNGDDEGWETDSSFSSLDSAELTSVPIDDHTHQYERLPMHRHHSHTDARPHRSKDGFHSHAHHHGANAVFHDDYELHLPNGRTVGHRSLRKYYRQNLHSYPSATERIERAQQMLENGEDDDSEMEDIPDSPQLRRTQIARRNEGGMLGATSAQKNFAMASEKRDRRHGERAQNRYQAKVEKQNNSQKHFRVSQDRANLCICWKPGADLYLGSSASVVLHAALRASAPVHVAIGQNTWRLFPTLWSMYLLKILHQWQ
jgi:pre-60S factor REI1